MATTLMPLDPATTPQHAQRLLPIAARLLPTEIISIRRTKAVRSRVIAVLVAVTLLLGGWYAFARYQVQEAKDDFGAAVAKQAAMIADQNNYSEVVQTQTSSNAISSRLSALLADDLRWAGLLSSLRGSAGASGITLTGMSGALHSSGGDAAAGQNALPGVSTSATIGTLTITGIGPDKDAVAQYVDRLADVAQFANPYLTNVTSAQKGVQFSMQVDITAQARGGRFTATPKEGN